MTGICNTDWQFEMFKIGKLMYSVYFKTGFLYFSNVCCWYTLELPRRGIMYDYNICSFNKRVFFTIKQAFTNFSTAFYVSV